MNKHPLTTRDNFSKNEEGDEYDDEYDQEEDEE
jgi:hypothetical protein